MNVACLGNKYLADEEPWKLIKTDEERVKTQMYVALQIAAALSTLAEPFLPFSAAKLKKMLNVTSSGVEMTWNQVAETSDLIPAGHQIGQAELLFAKIEDEEIQKQIDKLEATKLANAAEAKTAEPQKETDQYEELDRKSVE